MNRALLAFLLLGLALPLGAAEVLSLDRQTARRLGATDSHERPTILALWSSDCTHCKKNLRLMAALAKAEKPLRLVTVATEPDSPIVQGMLDSLALPGERYAYGSEAPEALGYALDSTWRGELPRTLIFDGKGNRKAVSGALQEAELRKGLGLPPRQKK